MNKPCQGFSSHLDRYAKHPQLPKIQETSILNFAYINTEAEFKARYVPTRDSFGHTIRLINSPTVRMHFPLGFTLSFRRERLVYQFILSCLTLSDLTFQEMKSELVSISPSLTNSTCLNLAYGKVINIVIVIYDEQRLYWKL